MAPKRRASQSGHRRKLRKPKQHSGLCSQCSEADFDTIFSSTAPDQSRYAETFTINSRSPSCVFCEFLASMGPFDSSVDGYIQLQLSHAEFESFPLLKASGANVLKVRCHNSFGGNRYFVSQSDPLAPIRVVEPNRVDYGIIQEWFQTCQNLHPDRCKPTSVNVPNMQLIDCETKAIVPASNHKYVTLSYLWGTDEDETPFSDQLLGQMPRTIEDALLVTRKLDFRYLWIDRYCINQQNKDETSTQLQAMGSIYRNSQATIIAAAGNDPSYGLPGRIDQLVNPSRWNSRGWTYQEGILATRRLLFTDEQVYFECHGMCCYESLALPYAAMHSPQNQSQRFNERYFTTPPGQPSERIGMFPAGYGGNACDIYIHIARYSHRNLSHDSDRLRAFLGILEAFENGRHGVRHHWGIPILAGPDPESPSKFSQTSFILGLMWGHKFRDENIRIKHLPSWSWSGMLGSVEFDYQMGDGSFLGVTTLLDEVQVQMELQNGDLLSWEAFHDDYMSLNRGGMGLSLGLSPYIHISAWSAPARTTPRRTETAGVAKHFLDQYRILSIDMADGSSVSHEVFMPGTALLECEVLVLGMVRGEVFMLVVHPTNEGIWDRVQRVFAASDENSGMARWSVTHENGRERRFEYRDKETHDLPRRAWGEEWWRFMKWGGRRTFRLG